MRKYSSYYKSNYYILVSFQIKLLLIISFNNLGFAIIQVPEMIIAIHGLMTYRSVSEFLFGSQSYTNKKQRIQNDVSENIRYFGKRSIKLHGCDNMKISNKRCEKLQ